MTAGGENSDIRFNSRGCSVCHQLGGVARPPVVRLDGLPDRVGVDPEVGLDDAAKAGHDNASDEHLLVGAPLEGQADHRSQSNHTSVPKTLLKVIR